MSRLRQVVLFGGVAQVPVPLDAVGVPTTLAPDLQVPRLLEFRDDPLPVSGAGKILKTELRKPHWDGQARSVN